MPLHPPLLPRQTLLPLQLWRPGIVGTQTQDRSCWIQPGKKNDIVLVCVRCKLWPDVTRQSDYHQHEQEMFMLQKPR